MHPEPERWQEHVDQYLRQTDAVGYDYRHTFDHFARLLKQALASRLTARGTQLTDLLQLTQHLSPPLRGNL